MREDEDDPGNSGTEDQWAAAIARRLGGPDAHPLEAAEGALQRFPISPLILVLAAFAALVEEKPETCLRLLQRLGKQHPYAPAHALCLALALAQQGRWPMAKNALKKCDRFGPLAYPPKIDRRWLQGWIGHIRHGSPRESRMPKPKRTGATSRSKGSPPPGAPTLAAAAEASPPPPAASIFPLPPAAISIRFALPDLPAFARWESAAADTPEDFRLRLDLTELALLKGFDDLLCLAHLHNIERHWYQVETVRKVLKQFRGRVLLADEVGLGKTIEAGMILKEYLLRGMADSVLILTPSALVGQWQEEMQTKFELDFHTTQDALFHRDPARFWTTPRIIASIATARRETHWEHIRQRPFDIVIVDEAHHLKNRTTQNWKLVDSLQKRFLLLLSATPIQNNLVELYNVLTLLKPGIFKTEKEFREMYMVPGKPRIPANRARLQDLMRDAMIRNTRALVDVRLPPRHVATLPVNPSAEEKSCYLELDRLARALYAHGEAGHHRLALHHLLEAAGSCPFAAAGALRRFLEHHAAAEWSALHGRYAALAGGAKVAALLELLRRNPAEKKLLFVRFHDTLDLLDRTLHADGIAFVRFDGSMTGPQKDAAIEAFRDQVPVLLSTESGGEGRNLQFCNTMVNFDLPWNPQTIEQRIGRIHRIGQTRDIFVFNLVTRDTIEERILHILDEKINMFELVVGEIQAILGAMEEEHDFTNLVLAAWLQTTEENRAQAFDTLGDKLLLAKAQYDEVKTLDEELFGEEFEVV